MHERGDTDRTAIFSSRTRSRMGVSWLCRLVILLVGCLLLTGCWDSSTSDKSDKQSQPQELGPPPAGQAEPDLDESDSTTDPAPQDPALGEPSPFGESDAPQ